MGNAGQESGTIRVALATEQDRETIYRLRHDVYASELAQHPENPEGRLTDRLDGSNTYITASLNGDIAGFISCTPPGQSGYAIEKYLSRQDLPVRLDERSTAIC